MNLYITDSKNILKNLVQLLNCKITENNYYYSKDDVVILIKGSYELIANGNIGRWILKLKDKDNDLIISVNYLSVMDIKIIKKIYSNEEANNIRLINFCESTVQGQLNFDIFVKSAGIDITNIDRIWLRENKITENTLKKTKLNKEFKFLSDSLICERLIDLILQYKSREIFGEYKEVKLKQLFVLSLLKERESQIEKKEKELEGCKDYFRIEFLCEDIKFKWLNSKDKIDRIYNVDEAQKVVTKIKDKQILITNISSTVKRKPHPLLYNTTDLINEAQKLKIGNIDTINEGLFNLFKNGHISNPNTESRHLPDEFINRSYAILSALKSTNNYRAYIEFIKSKEKIIITNRIINSNLVDKNHAIIPTEHVPILAELSQIENKIYNLIVKRFMAAFMGDTVIKGISIYGYIDENNHAKYEDTQIIEYGWSLLYLDDEENECFEGVINDSPQKKDINIDDINIESGKKYLISNIAMPVSNLKSKLRYSISNVLKLLDTGGKNIKNENKKVRRRHMGIGTIEERSKIIDEMDKEELINIYEDKRLALSVKGTAIIDKLPEQLGSLQYLKSTLNKIKAVQLESETIRDVVNGYLISINNILLEEELRKQREALEIDYSTILDKKICCYCFNKFIETEDYIICSNCGFKIPKVKCGYILKLKDFLDIINYGITDTISEFKFKGGSKKGKAKLYRTDKKGIAFDFGKQ